MRKYYAGGQWREDGGGPMFKDYEPYTGEVFSPTTGPAPARTTTTPGRVRSARLRRSGRGRVSHQLDARTGRVLGAGALDRDMDFGWAPSRRGDGQRRFSAPHTWPFGSVATRRPTCHLVTESATGFVNRTTHGQTPDQARQTTEGGPFSVQVRCSRSPTDSVRPCGLHENPGPDVCLSLLA